MKNSKYPLAPLSAFLHHKSDFTAIDDMEEYGRIRVQLHNKGIVFRDSIRGSELKTKKQQVIHDGALIVAEIDAKVGGFGIVPRELAGSIVSNHYYIYEIDESVCLRDWLDLYVRIGGLERQVIARGSTNYAAIRSRDVLEYLIPLPTLREQKRVLRPLKHMVSNTHKARSISKGAPVEGALLMNHIQYRVFEEITNRTDVEYVILGNIITRSVQVSGIDPIYSDYPYLSLGNIEAQSGRVVGSRTVEEAGIRGSMILFDERHVLYSKLRPYLNKVVVPEFTGCGTTEIVLLEPDPQFLDRYYLAEYLRNPMFVDGANLSAAGTRMPRTNMNWFREQAVPVPSIKYQQSVRKQIQTIRRNLVDLAQLQRVSHQQMDELEHSLIVSAYIGNL